MTIKGKPNVDDFLGGGAAAEAAPVTKKAATVTPGSPKRQKLVELPETVFEALKDRAYQEYKRTGKRVTETQIIIDALSQYLGLK